MAPSCWDAGDVSALEAGYGYVGFSALAYAGAAVGSGDEDGVAVAADASAEFGGEVGAGAHGDLCGEVDVSFGELGVCGVGLLRLSEEDADAFEGDLVGSAGHCGWPFFGFWVGG